MNILICISQIPETDARIKINESKKGIDFSEVNWIINPWDELALTRVVELKQNQSNLIESITVIQVSKDQSGQVLRRAIACGADRAVRIDYDPADSWEVAVQLSEYIKLNPFDLVVTGSESGDFNGKSVGGLIAGLSGYFYLPGITAIEVLNKKINYKIETMEGIETLETDEPMIAVIQKGIASAPAIPSIKKIAQSAKTTIEIIEPVISEPVTEYIQFSQPDFNNKNRIISNGEYSELINLLFSESGQLN